MTRGLLDVMRSECQLAGVLAHEVGHVAGRHSTNQLSLIFRAKRFYEIVKKQVLRDRDMVGDVIEKLGGALLLLGQLQYSRANETEADLLGYYNMMRAGWHPKGMLQFFNYLTQKEGDPSTIKTILSTHPKSSDRAETIRQEMLIAEPPSNLVETTQSFTAIRASILRLPPPSMKSLPGE